MPDETTRPLIQSISRAIAILQCFHKTQELRLSEISKMTGLHKSTAAGIIHTLKAERFLEQNEQSGKLKLGSALFLLAAKAHLRLEDICAPYLRSMLEETGETVNLAIRDGSEVVYIAKKESPHSMRISTSVGKRMPMYCTAIGKAILANLDKRTIEKITTEIELTPFTQKTITDPAQLIRMLDIIRQEGVAYDFEELEYGLTCIAAPIFHRADEVVGAISVSGPSIRMDDQTQKKITHQVTEIARKISADLSGTS